MTVIAICEGQDPNVAGALLILLVAVAVYALPVSLAFITAPAEVRPRLWGVFLAAIGLSVLFGLILPGGLSNTGANFFGLFVGGVASGFVLGTSVALWRPVGDVWRHSLLGTLGGGTFLAAGVGLLLFAFEASGACWG